MIVYVDWDNRKILSPEEYYKWRGEARNELLQDSENLENWLIHTFMMLDLWAMTDAEKTTYESNFKEWIETTLDNINPYTRCDLYERK